MGCSIERIYMTLYITWSVCIVVVLLRSPHLCCYHAFLLLSLLLLLLLLLLLPPSIHSSITDIVLFALIFQHPPLLSLLKQAGFPRDVLPFRSMQWIMIRLTQSGSTAWSTSLPKWLTKGGETGSQVLFPHLSPVMVNF